MSWEKRGEKQDREEEVEKWVCEKRRKAKTSDNQTARCNIPKVWLRQKINTVFLLTTGCDCVFLILLCCIFVDSQCTSSSSCTCRHCIMLNPNIGRWFVVINITSSAVGSVCFIYFAIQTNSLKRLDNLSSNYMSKLSARALFLFPVRPFERLMHNLMFF